MVIECIGLPQSGKTELIELVEKELRRREVDYVNISAGLRRRPGWKLLRIIGEALIFLNADARWLRERLRGILEKERGGEGAFDGEKKVIRKLALFTFCFRRMIRSHRLFLFDEGMIHTLLIFCAEHGLPEETFRKLVVEAERGLHTARLVIACEEEQQERDSLDREYERLFNVYKREFRCLQISKGDENRKKLSRVFGKIRRILSGEGER